MFNAIKLEELTFQMSLERSYNYILHYQKFHAAVAPPRPIDQFTRDSREFRDSVNNTLAYLANNISLWYTYVCVCARVSTMLHVQRVQLASARKMHAILLRITIIDLFILD